MSQEKLFHLGGVTTSHFKTWVENLMLAVQHFGGKGIQCMLESLTKMLSLWQWDQHSGCHTEFLLEIADFTTWQTIREAQLLWKS